MDIGELVATTTAFSLVSPFAEFIFFGSIRTLKRMIDQRSLCPCNKRNTNAKTI